MCMIKNAGMFERSIFMKNPENSKMKQEISRLLTNSGWKLTEANEGKDDSCIFQKRRDPKVIMQLDIVLTPEALAAYEHYGINCLEIAQYTYDFPLYIDDIRDMQKLIETTEGELLKTGIPFRPNYGFLGPGLERNLERNISLRKRFALDELERETLGGIRLVANA